MSAANHAGLFSAADLFRHEVPTRRWIVPGLIPDRTVTIISGDGGIGKSLLAMQLAVAVVGELAWIGLRATGDKVLYLTAEDDQDEIHRRLSDICRELRIDLSELKGLHFWNRAGKDAVLARREGHGVLKATPLWDQLRKIVEQIRPDLLILDTLADVFDGDEINRSQARTFIGMLRGLALEFNLGVIALAHPSVRGMEDGSGGSGSTAWNNSVRSRLFFKQGPSEEGERSDRSTRILEVVKSNYSLKGQKFSLRWENGIFKVETAVIIEQKNLAAQAAFLELLKKTSDQGRDVSPNPSSTYAPSVFSKHPAANGFRKRALESAMETLLEKDALHVEEFGPPSKRRQRLVIGPKPGT